MELNQIKQLLEKFYDGLTSLEEEKILQDFFMGNEVPAELEQDRDLFLYMAEDSKSIPINNLDQKLTDWIDRQERSKDKIIKLRWNHVTWLSIAASIAILVTCYFTILKPEKNSDRDTYKNPQLAYMEAKRALLYVSMQLNKGTEPLSNIDKINEGVGGLEAFSSLSNGLEQLELVSKYGKKIDNENNNIK